MCYVRPCGGKSFDKKLHDYRTDLLDEDVSTYFLFCNAHFLLGLALEVENVVRVVEKKVKAGGLLGRDNDPAFSRFANSKENAATLLVRMTAEVLGPIGKVSRGVVAIL
ncbi:hypothetical protein PoB_003262500 [Plakobranchus ocellatus]|uniref:Uncharacterized protein n=1 Tax=Plakobranchus ocellatus TaxID=259542 RepID=A0AAV4AH80_9GAST|nr:hypothetical protein PoB_003262500 [Plakobranchus ocellatus]